MIIVCLYVISFQFYIIIRIIKKNTRVIIRKCHNAGDKKQNNKTEKVKEKQKK